MIVTWTVLRSRSPTETVPWRPRGASWWQAGRSSPGRPGPPIADGTWWSVIATWDDLLDAERGPGSSAGIDGWHVVLEPASFRGDAVLAGGARPFDALPRGGRAHGAVALVTLAGSSPDSGREREFFRRFLHLGRDVSRADGLLTALVHAPDDGAVLTFSVWEDLEAALDWAYVQPQHAAAVARQKSHRLVRTTGYLRCAVLSSTGTLGDLPDPLAGRVGSVTFPDPAPGTA